MKDTIIALITTEDEKILNLDFKHNITYTKVSEEKLKTLNKEKLMYIFKDSQVIKTLYGETNSKTK